MQVRRRSSVKEIGVGIIGCGYWGPNLVRNLNALGDCKVRWICDLRATRLHHLSSLYSNIKTTNDFRRILSDDRVNAVVVATPVSTHFDLARAGLLAGKHVFVEKPLARSFLRTITNPTYISPDRNPAIIIEKAVSSITVRVYES